MLTKKELDKQIATIMDTFDFHSVWLAMDAVKWRYAGTAGTPSLARLRGTARSLLKDLGTMRIKHGGWVSSGGFCAYLTADKKRIGLDFVLRTCEIDEDGSAY